MKEGGLFWCLFKITCSDLTRPSGSMAAGVSWASTVLARVDILLRPGRVDSRLCLSDWLVRVEVGAAESITGEVSMAAVTR